jgi:serine phosphatase RsbU (regulator of sigma subunit)
MSTYPRQEQSGSLRGTFLAAILVVYVIVAALTILAFARSAGRVSERFAARFCSSQNELGKNRILDIVDRELALSRKLADDPSIKSWVLREDDPVLRRAAADQLESYRRFLHDGAYFLAIRSSGSYYARTPTTSRIEKTILRPDNASDRWFYNAISADADYSLNVDHNDMLDENRVWINVLMRDSGGKAIGIAGCGMDLTAFLSALLDHPEPGITTVIVDAKGALQAYGDRSLITHNAEVKRDAEKIDIYRLLPKPSDRDALRSQLASSAGKRAVEVFPVSFLGRRELCGVSSLEELGWYNVVFVDSSRILGFADFIPVAAVTFLALLAVLAAVITVTNRLVILPIAELTRAAGQVAGGSYDIVLPSGSRNEIGILGSSFSTMAGKIKEYTQDLESLVDRRTMELREANADLEASRKRMVDSIEYARLIQDSILPSENDLDSGLDGHFIIERQRDLVGGDFVFYRAMDDGFCLAVTDCTGHGVPGAFMTMLTKAHLDRVVASAANAAPSEMLRELDRLVSQSLGRESETAHFENGLDIALCRYRRSQSALLFSGAGLPLFVWCGGELREYPGEHSHLGFAETRRKKVFSDHRVDVEAGIRVYLVSDGVLDLPGGERGLPLGLGRLESLLSELAALPFPEAGARAGEALSAYQGDRPQRDDLTFVGFGLRNKEI